MTSLPTRTIKIYDLEDLDVPELTEILRKSLNDKGLTVTLNGMAEPMHNEPALCELASALMLNLCGGE